MSKFTLSLDTSEEGILKIFDSLLELSAFKASEMLHDIGVYEILNRPRSPEEIFHMLNFNSMEFEFAKVFDLLAEKELLTKQGEFYGDSPRREYLETSFKENFKVANSKILAPINSLMDKSASKYKEILKGEQGKLNELEYIQTLDSFFGTELMFLIRDLYFKSLKLRMPLFDIKEKLTVFNWGVGSGYDALHMADFFGDSFQIVSAEPKNSVYRCQVLQDLYEIYNVDFVEREEIEIDELQNSIDLYFGTKFLYKEELKNYINYIQFLLNPNGYLTFSFIPQLSSSIDWFMSIHEPYFHDLERESHIANLKHNGITREKYIGLNNSFILMQKV